MRALFFVTPGAEPNDNQTRIPAAFARHGWSVEILPHESLALCKDGLTTGATNLDEYDLIWPIGFGPKVSYLDRTQLLAQLAPGKLITPSQIQNRLHAKTAWFDVAPPSVATNDPAVVRGFMQTHAGPWVLKPTAGSYGRGVIQITDIAELDQLNIGPEYCICQCFIEEIRSGECRTLIANGHVLGSYLRMPPAGEFTANLSSGAQAQAVTLNESAVSLVERVLSRLNAERVGFAAIDICANYVLEVNVANPGGLETLQDLYGHDFSDDLVQAVSRRYPTCD